MPAVNERLLHGCLRASVADIIDAGVDLLPHFELAAIPLLNGNEQPAEWPEVRRRLRAEGIRSERHRGAILIAPGELDHFSTVGLFEGSDELFLCSEWNDEFEPFPGRIGTDVQDFSITTPLGLEEWMIDTGCLLALGDGAGLNFATLDAALAERLMARFKPSQR
jgi:hypothetical protein